MSIAALKSLQDQSADAFAFGANWRRFLETVDEERIARAVGSLSRMLGEGAFAGRRFLDVGCGSGLFSLAAHRLGAEVVSIDVDADSVACARELRDRFAPDASDWEIRTGSALDAELLAALGQFDIVYSWGVVHHTGAMWDAIDLLQKRVAPGGLLWLAIYNDQGFTSRVWMLVKRGHQRLPRWLQMPYVILVGGTWMAWRGVLRVVQAGLAKMLPRTSAAEAQPSETEAAQTLGRARDPRGMHWWYDLVDWIGGWPFEVAKPEEVFQFLTQRGFELVELKTVGGRLGCNEYVFRKHRTTPAPDPL